MKKFLTAVSVIFFSFLVIAGCLALYNPNPKAKPLNFPTEESVTSITVSQIDEIPTRINETDFEELLQIICSAEPTRKPSVNDRPYAESYYILDVETSAMAYRYFIYTENSKIYLESPYQGIYRADQQLWNFITAYFK